RLISARSPSEITRASTTAPNSGYSSNLRPLAGTCHLRDQQQRRMTGPDVYPHPERGASADLATNRLTDRHPRLDRRPPSEGRLGAPVGEAGTDVFAPRQNSASGFLAERPVHLRGRSSEPIPLHSHDGPPRRCNDRFGARTLHLL